MDYLCLNIPSGADGHTGVLRLQACSFSVARHSWHPLETAHSEIKREIKSM